jgi:predicted ATP-grasp superfamily ATP-dependent carboligase/thymidylate kinase
MTRNEPTHVHPSRVQKRRGFTVALIGPDGAGKTSVARRLAEVLPPPVTYLYMGVNPDSSNLLLPSTRLIHAVRRCRARGGTRDTGGPRDSRRPDRASPKGRVKRSLRTGRSFLRLANRLAEEWQRAFVASVRWRRGSIVVFDRHFFADYYAYDVAAPGGRSASRRVHGFVLARLYPKPDLVFYLDAPAETLFIRKGEGTLESLARRRREYLDLGRVMSNFAVVDADRPLDDVVREVAALVEDFANGEQQYRESGVGTSTRPPVRQARVLVTDAARGSAISIIRSLGRRGMHVIAADSEARSPGFYSRYAAERLRYPSPEESPEEMVEVLLTAARTRRIDLIVPITDETILPLAAARERFAGLCMLALPEPRALATSHDKMATVELAAELGIPLPRTELVSTVNAALRAAPALGWPVVVKPRFSRIVRDGRGVERYAVSYAADGAALAEQMAGLEGRCDVLLQEYCAGEAHGVEVLAHEGRPIAAFQHRRLREVPITGGASSFRESVALEPVLLDHSARLLAALEWTGLAMVEFKVGEEGPRLMEVNGRVWGSLPLAVKSGIDFPAGLADVCFGNLPGPDDRPNTSYAVGVRSRNLDLEMVWIGSTLRQARPYPGVPVPRRRQAVAAALRLLYPGDGFDILTREDPRPGLVELARIAGKLRGKLARGR